MEAPTVDSSALLLQVRRAALTLSNATHHARCQAIQYLIDGLRQHQNELLEANTLDLEMSRELAVPGTVLDWLKLTPERLNRVSEILEQLVHLPDPLAGYQALPTIIGMRQVAPVGVVGFVYEAFPELAIILAAMCWKTGNGLLLQGDRMGQNSNQFVVELLQQTLAQADLPEAALQAVLKDRADWSAVDLLIPYGRPSFIQQVHQQSTVPTLCPTMGNCYLYWSETCNYDPVRALILNSHIGCPEAVHAIEKVLLPPTMKTSRLTLLWGALKERGFEIRGDAELVAEFPELTLATKSEWHQPYLQKIVAFKRMADLDAAVRWMNTYSHGQADCLVTESYTEGRQFALNSQCAIAYINASSQFSRQFGGPQGTIAFGTCGRRSAYPGVISLHTLLTPRQVIQGAVL